MVLVHPTSNSYDPLRTLAFGNPECSNSPYTETMNRECANWHENRRFSPIQHLMAAIPFGFQESGMFQLLIHGSPNHEFANSQILHHSLPSLRVDLCHVFHRISSPCNPPSVLSNKLLDLLPRFSHGFKVTAFGSFHSTLLYSPGQRITEALI
jgi:hypothetical protein